MLGTVGRVILNVMVGMAILVAVPATASPARMKLPASKPKPAKTPPPLTLTAFVANNGTLRLDFLDSSKAGFHAGWDDFALNLPAGLTVFKTTHPIDIKDVRGSAFLEMTPGSFLALANVDGSSPALAEAPFDVNLTYTRDNERALIKGHGTLAAPLTPEGTGLTSLSLSGTSSGNLKERDGTLHVIVAGEAIATRFPVSALRVNFTEGDALTSLSVSVTVTTQSVSDRVRDALKDTKEAETEVRQLLAQGGFDVDTVEIKRLETPPELTGYETIITVKDFRHTLQVLSRFLVAQAGHAAATGKDTVDYVVVNQAVSKMLNLNIDSFEIQAQRTGDTLDGTITSRVSGLDQFLVGYFELYGQLVKLVKAHAPVHVADRSSADDLFLEIGVRQMQVLLRVMQQPAAVTDHSDLKYDVSVKSEAERFNVEGSIDANIEVKGLLQAAREQGLPTIDRDDFLLAVKSSAGHLVGHLRLSENGNWMDSMRNMYASVAEQFPEYKTVAPIIRSLTLSDLRASVRLKDGNLEGTAFARTSPLTDLSRWILARLAPKFAGTVTAVQYTHGSADGVHSTNAGDIFVSSWTGATRAQVSKVLGDLTHRSITVKMGVDPATLKAPDLTAPTVDIPEDLVEDSKPRTP